MSEDTPMLTASQLSVRWSVSARTVTRMAVAGDVPALRIRSGWRFPEAAIIRWERRNLTGVQSNV